MVKPTKAERKTTYDGKLCKMLDIYSQILVVAADNVGSNQLQNIRKGLRGDSVVLMGKNTMMKRSIRAHADKTGNNDILNLVPLLVVRFWAWIRVFFFTCLDCRESFGKWTFRSASMCLLFFFAFVRMRFFVRIFVFLDCLVAEKVSGNESFDLLLRAFCFLAFVC